MKFSVYGKILMGKEERTFQKEVEAATENAAKEKIYTLFGSKNGLIRTKIKISKIEKSEGS